MLISREAARWSALRRCSRDEENEVDAKTVLGVNFYQSDSLNAGKLPFYATTKRPERAQ
jgi:hypothetical protein